MSDVRYRLDCIDRVAHKGIDYAPHTAACFVPIEIDYENPVTYLHATIWSLRNDWEADRPMPNEDELLHWVERIIALGIEGGDE